MKETIAAGVRRQVTHTSRGENVIGVSAAAAAAASVRHVLHPHICSMSLNVSRQNVHLSPAAVAAEKSAAEHR